MVLNFFCLSHHITRHQISLEQRRDWRYPTSELGAVHETFCSESSLYLLFFSLGPHHLSHSGYFICISSAFHLHFICISSAFHLLSGWLPYLPWMRNVPNVMSFMIPLELCGAHCFRNDRNTHPRVDFFVRSVQKLWYLRICSLHSLAAK